MIVKKQENNYKTVNFESSKKMNIDQESLDILLPALSENLYSNPIGSIVREWTSNALDATKEAGVDKKVVVGIDKKDNQFIFFVEDFGTGISEEKVDKIISKFGASTKRETNDQFGFFGLGLKSGLSYKTSFYILTRFEGFEYTYVIYKTEGGSNVDLISKVETALPNGTKIFINVDYSDIYQFESEIINQLLYLDNIEFTSYNEYSKILELNSSTIYEAKTFKYSNRVVSMKMHICYNDICYPIDFDKLDMDSYSIPIGIKVSHLDEIFPTPNRESFVYTEKTKKILRKKIQDVANEIFEIINNKKIEVKTLLDIIKFDGEHLKLGDDKFYVIPLLSKFCKKTFSKFPNILNLKYPNYDFFNNLHLNSKTGTVFIETGRISNSKIIINDNVGHTSVDLNKSIILTKNNSPILKKYICTTYTGYKIIRIQQFQKIFSLYQKAGKNCLYKILNLSNYNKKDWRSIIVDFKTIYDNVEKEMFKDVDIVVPQSFIDEYKRNKKKKVFVKNDEISLRECYYSTSLFKSVCSTRQILSLINGKISGDFKTVVYSSDEAGMKSLVSALRYHKNITFVVVGKKDEKKLNLIKSKTLISMNELKEMDVFKRIAIRIYLNNFIKPEHTRIKERLETYMDVVQCDYKSGKTIDCKYVSLYKSYKNEINIVKNSNYNLHYDEFKEIINYVETNPYFKPFLQELKEFDEISKTFSFLELFKTLSYSYEKEKYKKVIDCIVSICKSKGIRLNYSFYKYLNPESIEAEIEKEIENA
jgi:hypothetical protein